MIRRLYKYQVLLYCSPRRSRDESAESIRWVWISLTLHEKLQHI